MGKAARLNEVDASLVHRTKLSAKHGRNRNPQGFFGSLPRNGGACQ